MIIRNCLEEMKMTLCLTACIALGCSGESPTLGSGATGGVAASGGSISSGGLVGTSATGGNSTIGGASSVGGTATSAGTTALGGSATTGGVSTVGGSAATGGISAMGGSTTSGGASIAGATAGGASGLGGTAATGGTATIGGSGTIAGATGSGGTPSTGGSPATGGSGAISGGATNGGATNFQTCQLVPQSGCTGQACDLDLTHLDVAGTTCRPVTTAGTELNTCTGMSDCAAGYLCLDNECARYCATDANCDAPGGLCVITLYANGTTPIAGVALCSPNCNPLTAAGCPSGQGCGVYANADGRQYTACHAASTGTQGTACTNDLDCAPGFGCINFTSNGTTTVECMQLCQPTVTVCPAAMSCLAFNPAVTVGPTSFGICN